MKTGLKAPSSCRGFDSPVDEGCVDLCGWVQLGAVPLASDQGLGSKAGGGLTTRPPASFNSFP